MISINLLLVLLVCGILGNVYSAAIGGVSNIRAVSIFRADESDLHKYSAVLAATEPIRVRCDNEIKRAMNPLAYVYHFVKRTKLKDPNGVIRIENKAVDQACTRFENRVDEVMRSYGMSPETFNSISYRMKTDGFMKQRILLQAYFYRIAADLESNIKSPPELPMSSTTGVRIPVSAAAGSRRNTGAQVAKARYLLYGSSRFERFCHALYEVEAERLRQREDLQSTLGIPDLPTRMCDDDMLPAMCSQVQGACAQFPAVVSNLVQECGVPPAEFDRLNRRMKRNVLFRMRVQQEINKIDRREARAARLSSKKW